MTYVVSVEPRGAVICDLPNDHSEVVIGGRSLNQSLSTPEWGPPTSGAPTICVGAKCRGVARDAR